MVSRLPFVALCAFFFGSQTASSWPLLPTDCIFQDSWPCPRDCSYRGTCGEEECKCAPPWTGPTCMQRCNSTCDICADEATCLRCKATAVLSSGKCECAVGQLMSPSGECVYPGACVDFCEECSGPSDCFRCIQGATLYNSTSCKCGPGTYPEDGKCRECGHLCESCTSPFSCNSCFSIAHFDENNETCVCNSGQETPDGWCQGECPKNSHLNEDNWCECDVGFYTITTVSECLPCTRANCTNCQSSEVFVDGHCRQGYSCEEGCPPLGENTSECVSRDLSVGMNNETCKAGYSLHGSFCLDCGRLCAECSSKGQCTACEPGASLRNSMCACDEGTVYDWSLHSCQPFHGKYRKDTCWPHSFPLKDTCMCESGYFSPENSSECLRCDVSCRKCIGSADFCTSCPFLSILNRKTGQCTCRNNMYLDNLTGGCEECLPMCEGCTEKFNCLSCKPTTERIENICLCPANSEWSKSSNMCCHESCASCSQPFEKNACTNCLSGATLTEDGTCVCNSGYYWNQTWGSCKKCPFGCEECNEFNCTRCQVNSYLNETTGKCTCANGYYECFLMCKKCSKACETCEERNRCTSCPMNSHLTELGSCECDPGFHTMTDASECVLCSQTNCTNCELTRVLTNGICKCKQGYYDNYLTGECEVDCSLLCEICKPENATECLLCDYEAELQNGTCVCREGSYQGEIHFWPCGELCAECRDDEHCLSCKSGAVLKENTCECAEGSIFNSILNSCQLFNGTYTNDTCWVHSYASNSTCVCYPGYYSVEPSTKCYGCNYSCRTCQGAADFCTSCWDFAELNVMAGECTCPHSHYRSEWLGFCRPCPPTCDGCLDEMNCLSCKPTTERRGNTCLCPANSEWSERSSMCCHVSCADCSQSFSKNECIACPFGADLTADSTCECTTGFYLDNALEKCMQCPFGCKECEDEFACKRCEPDKYLNETTGICRCLSGYYAYLGECLKCSSQCATCDRLWRCSSCHPNAHLTPDGSCECDSGFYTMTHVSECEPCPLGDAICTSCQPTEFLVDGFCKCKSGYHHNSTTGVCVQGCPAYCHTCKAKSIAECKSCRCKEGFYWRELNCEPCGKLCSLCTYRNHCLACKPGASLHNFACKCEEGTFYDWYSDSCQPLNGTYVHAVCGPNSYPINGKCICYADSYSTENSTDCYLCDSSCKTCKDTADNCTSCKQFAELNATTGECTCSSSSYWDEWQVQCRECPLTCNGCTDAANCQSCKPTAERMNNTCTCPVNAKWSVHSNMCCHETCDSCSLPFAENSCTACSFGARLTANGTCECRSGFFWNVSSKICDYCPFGSDECNGLSYFRCQAVAHLNETTGKCSCNDGYFAGLHQCWKCHESCATCSSPYFCASCHANAYLTTFGFCQCNAGFYTTTNVAACIPCPHENPDCESCRPNAILEDGICICKWGYHHDNKTEDCAIHCSPNCATCQPRNSTECLTCKKGAELNNETHACNCMKGFYLKDSSCEDCGLLCAECTSEGQCLACVSGASFFTNSTCQCSEDTHFDSHTKSCQTTVLIISTH